MGTVVNLKSFSSKQDASHSKEKSVPLENVSLENLVRVENGLFTPELEADLQKLSKMTLRQKYKHEAHSHKNRKTACKAAGGAFAPEFEDFRSFLAHVGICPHLGWTLDRIDNTNPDYGPGLVRWASPKTQTRNRSTTVTLTVDGQTRPLAQWAEITGKNPGTMRKQLERGWSDREIVYGKQTASAGKSEAERQWRELLPEPMWSQWEWFERNTTAYGTHSPPAMRSMGAESFNDFVHGPLGRALRLYCTAGSRLSDLDERLFDAQQYAEGFQQDYVPDPELTKQHAFWTGAHARAWSVLTRGAG